MGLLSDQVCVVGVGGTAFMKASNRTTLSMSCEAIKNAMDDAGFTARDVDGVAGFQVNDSVRNEYVAHALGIQMNYGCDLYSGGSTPEAIALHAAGLIAGGFCHTVAIYRSMNGRTGRRMGGQAAGGPGSIVVDDTQHYNQQFSAPAGLSSAGGLFGISAMRYLHEFGASTRTFGEIAATFRHHASLNPRALMRTPITVEDHQRSRWVVKPFRLLDFCLENDTAQAFIVTSRERAYDLKQPPVYILGGIARQCSPDPAGGWNYSRPRFYIHSGIYARKRLWENAGVRPEDIEVASFYDAMSYCVIEELEAFGFCDIGEAPGFIAGGRLGLDGQLPSNTGGGQLSEGYAHGVGLINDVVRQLRHRADDACPGWAEGKHTYDRAAGCRQVRKARLGACISEGGDTRGSALILRS